MREISLKQLEEYMLKNIDTTNLVEVDKVKRYVNLTQQFRRMSAAANKHDAFTVVINASQEFPKTNPAVDKMGSISSQLNALYKTIEFKMPEPEYEDEPIEEIEDSLDDAELV